MGGRYQLLSWLNLGVTYSLDANQNHALGAHALLKAGPLQLVAGADHLPGVFNWRQTRYSQVYAGLALAFGGRDPEE